MPRTIVDTIRDKDKPSKGGIMTGTGRKTVGIRAETMTVGEVTTATRGPATIATTETTAIDINGGAMPTTAMARITIAADAVTTIGMIGGTGTRKIVRTIVDQMRDNIAPGPLVLDDSRLSEN
jgi:hypothetical protein